MALVVLRIFTISPISCSGEERFTVNEVIDRRVEGGVAPAGSGCMYVELPGSGGASNDVPGGGDFSVAEGPSGDGFLVRVFSDDALLTTRSYDAAMLASGRVDEFSVTTHSGALYALRYWGGPCVLGADGSAD